VIYCVVPEALAGELFDKLTDYYSDDPNVTVIIERRKSSRRGRHGAGASDSAGGARTVRDRRRPRIVGELPDTPPGS
jgi:hypothetical protein